MQGEEEEKKERRKSVQEQVQENEKVRKRGNSFKNFCFKKNCFTSLSVVVLEVMTSSNSYGISGLFFDTFFDTLEPIHHHVDTIISTPVLLVQFSTFIIFISFLITIITLIRNRQRVCFSVLDHFVLSLSLCPSLTNKHQSKVSIRKERESSRKRRAIKCVLEP